MKIHAALPSAEPGEAAALMPPWETVGPKIDLFPWRDPGKSFAVSFVEPADGPAKALALSAEVGRGYIFDSVGHADNVTTCHFTGAAVYAKVLSWPTPAKRPTWRRYTVAIREALALVGALWIVLLLARLCLGLAFTFLP